MWFVWLVCATQLAELPLHARIVCMCLVSRGSGTPGTTPGHCLETPHPLIPVNPTRARRVWDTTTLINSNFTILPIDALPLILPQPGVGTTNPATASAGNGKPGDGSFRRAIYENWEGLGLEEEPNTSLNGVR